MYIRVHFFWYAIRTQSNLYILMLQTLSLRLASAMRPRIYTLTGLCPARVMYTVFVTLPPWDNARFRTIYLLAPLIYVF